MSRSYKRTPWAGDTKGKYKKRLANRKVRTFLKDLNNDLKNSDYKKVYESWDICDYGWYGGSWEQYKKWVILRNLYYPTLFPPKEEIDWKEEYRRWYKSYRMK